MNFQTFKLITAPVLEEHGNFELAAKKNIFGDSRNFHVNENLWVWKRKPSLLNLD